MDTEIRNPVAGRNEVENDASHDSPTPHDSPIKVDSLMGETAPPAGTRVRLCKWCGQIDIRGARRKDDVMLIYVHGTDIRAFWNGRSLIVQDGICEPCGEKLKKENSSLTSSDLRYSR